MFVDVEGIVEGINHKTHEKVVVQFHPKVSPAKNSYVEGKAFDSQGKQIFEITGSWHNQIVLTHVENKISEVVWQEPPLMTDANLQYFFNERTVMLNALSAEMNNVVAPTDSRFRMDLRLFEKG